MLKAVIFDMDGVLIDTVSIGLQTRKRILATQYNVDLDAVPDSMGLDHRIASMPTLLADVKAHTGLHINQEEFTRHEVRAIAEDLPKLGAVDPALVALLNELQDHKIICAIATTGQRKMADVKLDTLGIRRYFSLMVTGDDVASHKPDPAAYLYTMQQLAVAADECMIIEDSLPGIQAGLAAGCRVVGFTQYSTSKEPLSGVATSIDRWSDTSCDRLASLVDRAR